MAGIILTVDIGTSSLKAAFIDSFGRLIAFSRMPYRSLSLEAGGCDTGIWKRAFVLALENLHTLSPDSFIEGICISGNGPTLVPVSREGEAMPPLYWYDSRTYLPPECEVRTEKGISGTRSFFLPHAAWLKKNNPEEYSKTALFISSHEWLAHELGAEALTVLPQVSYGSYYWDDEQCRLFGLERNKFPPFIKTGELMGYLSAEAVSKLGSGLGLKSGTPIIAGGPDFITALIGTGTWNRGDVCDRAGSSEGINVCACLCSNAAPTESGGLRVLPHAREGFWNIGAVIPSSGGLFEQYRIVTGQKEKAYEELLAELIPSREDTEIFRNLEFSPPVGNSSPVPRSTLEFGRSVLCAIGFAVRNAVETLERQGFPVKAMKVSGGQGKNSRWNQLKADIVGLSLMIPEIGDGELAGNAVLAAAALEGTSSLEELMNRMIRVREVYRPGNADFWERQYRLHIQS